GGVDDDRDPGGRLVESLLQAKAKVLERVERPLSAVGVLVLVARDEAQRLCLDPRHPPSRVVDDRACTHHRSQRSPLSAACCVSPGTYARPLPKAIAAAQRAAAALA